MADEVHARKPWVKRAQPHAPIDHVSGETGCEQLRASHIPALAQRPRRHHHLEFARFAVYTTVKCANSTDTPRSGT
jgi:hypothetical protein